MFLKKTLINIICYFQTIIFKKKKKVMLEIQTISQKNLQTANVVSNYW